LRTDTPADDERLVAAVLAAAAGGDATSPAVPASADGGTVPGPE
jgi:hypothetical protein